MRSSIHGTYLPSLKHFHPLKQLHFKRTPTLLLHHLNSLRQQLPRHHQLLRCNILPYPQKALLTPADAKASSEEGDESGVWQPFEVISRNRYNPHFYICIVSVQICVVSLSWEQLSILLCLVVVYIISCDSLGQDEDLFSECRDQCLWWGYDYWLLFSGVS